MIMIRKWMKKLLAPMIRETLAEEFNRALDTNTAIVKTKPQQTYTPKRTLMTQEELQRYIGH